MIQNWVEILNNLLPVLVGGKELLMPRMIVVVLMLFSFCHLVLGFTPLSAWASDGPPAASPQATSAMKQKPNRIWPCFEKIQKTSVR